MSTAKKTPRRRSRLPAWSPQPRPNLVLKRGMAKEPAVERKLQRLLKGFGLSAAAEILDVDKAQLSRCANRKEPIGEELARRISDVEYIVERALRVMHEDEIGSWLIAPEPLLGGATPLNTLAVQGAGPVAAALDGIFAGVLV
jgi:uncharacterized protein (DUF2384 family)